MSFPSEAFFASVYQTSLPDTDLKLTNFPLPSQSFFIGIPYIIGFVVAETPSNAATALYLYDRNLYDSINQVPFSIDLLRAYNLPQGVSKKIGLYGTDLSKDNTFQKPDESFPTSTQDPPVLNKIIKGVMMYTSHGYFQYGRQLYYFSTLDNGSTLYGSLPGISPVAALAQQFIPAIGNQFITERNPLYVNLFGEEPFGPEFITAPNPLYIAAQIIPAVAAVAGFPSISGITVNPDNSHRYNVFRYFTYLNYGNVNLNTNPSFLLGWGSSDLAGITGDYGADVALLSMYKENNTQQGTTIPVTYNYPVDSNRLISGIRLISIIPSGRYYYVYDFVSTKIAAIQAAGYSMYYPIPPDDSNIQKTPVFTFITKFLQSITIFPTSIPPGGTITIVPDFGIGYPLYTYQITINDATDSTRRSALAPVPFQYTPPLTTNTKIYTITVNGSDDINDTNTRTAQFTAYQYVANIAVSTLIRQSARNFITWTGGSTIEQFQYGSTSITTNGSLNFESGNKIDAAGLVAGNAYTIKPTNVNEINPSGAYPTVYFDSIEPNQQIFIASSQSLQRYTLSWNAYYKFNSPAPDGTRQYVVTFTGNGTTYTATSTYNVLVVPFSAVTFGIPYSIQIEDIIVATNIFFFDVPTNFSITPSNINFNNTITWISDGNPVFNVRMGRYLFQSRSPYTNNLTENIIDPEGDVSFWSDNATESSSIVIDSYVLNENTISVTLPSSILLFSGAVLSFDVGTYLYPSDTYSLSLYRNGAVVQQLEASITNPFTWIPFKYIVTYQTGDQLYIKSNQHLNYGLSIPFTLIVNTPTNIRVVPSRINYENTISWSVEDNPVLNVKMGNYVFQSSSPYTYNLTEDIIDPIGNISFWAIGSDLSRAVVAGSYTLSSNTIFVILSSSILFFSGVFFYIDIFGYLYPSDTYSLSLYRNNAIVKQLEASIIPPFTWIPYNYVVTYQPGDQLYIKSNQHLNYGISVPFTFVVNASVTVDQSQYTIFSSIVATMIDADADVAFTAQLRGPFTIPVAFTQEGDQYTIQLKNYNIPLGNYQLDFFVVNSPTIIVSSPTFLVTTPVTVDQPEYTIISTVNATLYVGVPTTFTVRLQDVDQLFPSIVLPSFTANLLSTYSFRLYGLPVKDANYVLLFTAGTVLISPIFAISTSYFSLEKPVVSIPPSRATTNTLCVTTKKNNIPTTIISIRDNIVYPTAIRGQPQFLVPCGILPYLKELTELLKTLTLRNALLFLIQKYNIPQSTPAVTNQKRYQLPTANSKVLNPILQFTSSFRLRSKVTGNSVPINTFFAEKLSDARVLTLCNDDTKTFSSSYTDMLKNATYWLSTLAQFKKDGDYTFCVVRPIQGTLKQFITASISLKDNVLIFTPVIARLVLSFYEPYGPVDFSIMFTSPLLSEIVKYLLAQYEKIYINPATAL